MKALSVWQPWASAIALGIKRIETRGRRINHLGELAICASKKRSGEIEMLWRNLYMDHPDVMLAFFKKAKRGCDYTALPFGCVVAVVQVSVHGSIEFWSDSVSETDRALGDFSKGRFVMGLSKVRRVKNPVPVIGRQGLFNLPAEVEAQVRAQL